MTIPGSFSVSPELDGVLLDLDNTLCPTDHLRWIRSKGDRVQLAPHLPGLCAYRGMEEALAELARVVPLGIVSRTHRWYVEDVLTHLFPHVRWRAVVSYDDVPRQKPYPDGLQLAAQRMGLSVPSRIAYLGDSKSDIEAAYHAGMRPVLCTWEPSSAAIASAQQIIPDAVLAQPAEILSYASDPGTYLPYLESLLRGKTAPTGTRRSVSLGTFDPFRIDVLGRYFADAGSTLHLHQAHPLSKWIERKDEPGQFEQPRLVEAMRAAVVALVQEYGLDTVTVIPGKPGGTPRMERLFSLVGDQLRGVLPVSFELGMLAFSEDAQRIKYFSQSKRREEIERSLRLVGSSAGKRVMVVDDVLTSGGTMLTARQLLLGGGATYVAGLAMAKTISGYSFDADPTYRECPRCGRRVTLIRRKDGGRFWGCEGFRIDGCKYTTDA
jgi:beta-phosphoglucomutase-like phosphatase (HAD superfamily)